MARLTSEKLTDILEQSIMREKKPGRPPIGQEPLIHSATGLTQTQRDFVNSQRGGNFAERLRFIVDAAANSGCAVAAINYALKSGYTYGFLDMWIESDFKYLKLSFPDAPDSVFPKGGE